MHKAVFLDRDNTIIHNDGDLGDPNQVRLIQGAAAAIGSLRGLGYRIVIITNQGGVARGAFTEEDVDRTHARIAELVRQSSGASIDRFYYCPFHPEGTVEKYRTEHPWRKPQPGMLLQAATDMDIDLRQSWTVGDQLRDVQAGNAAGTHTILLANAMPEGARGESEPDFIAKNLVEAVRTIAQRPQNEEEVKPEVRAQILRTSKSTRPPESAADNAAAPSEPAPSSQAVQPSTEEKGSEDREPIPAPAPAVPFSETPLPQDASPRDQSPSESNDELLIMLRELQRSLRQNHADEDDFSWPRLFAIILLIVSLGCLAFSFNSVLVDNGQFANWLLGAVVALLYVIAALLWAKK